MAVVAPRLLQQIDDVLGVAQIGEIGRCGDDHLVRLQEDALAPRRPRVRQIDRDVGHVLSDDVYDLIAAVDRNVIVAIEHDGSGEDRQMLGAFGQQAIKQHFVEAIRARQGIGNALHRILIEIEAGRAEGEIEVGNDDVDLEYL